MGAGRGLAIARMVALAWLVASAGCASPPTTSSGRPAPAEVSASDVPEPPSGGGAIAAFIVVGPAGFARSAAGRPGERTPVLLPAGRWQATAAIGPDDTVLLVSAAGSGPPTALVGRLGDGGVAPLWRVVLPGDAPDAAPGCVGGDAAATVIASSLLALTAGGVRAVRDVPATVGRCQMAGANTVWYVTEDDHAIVAWSLATGTVARSRTTCDDISVAGAWIACLATGGSRVMVGRLAWPVAGQGILAAPAVIPLDGPAAQVLLAPGAELLAVVAADGRRVTFYRRLADGMFTRAGASLLETGETMLGFVGP